MKGGDPNPITTNTKNGIIGNYPMFNYDHDQTKMPGEVSKVGDTIQISPDALKAANEKRETEQKKQESEDRLKESKEPKVEGIEANRIASLKKMEENQKKDKIDPPTTAPASKNEESVAN